MDATVTLIIVAIYFCAIFAPLAVYAIARRTGHGAWWQSVPLICAAVIWSVLALGFVQEFLSVSFLSDVLEHLRVLAILALAVVLGVGFWLSVKRWPRIR